MSGKGATPNRWRLRWRTTWSDGAVGWYQNDNYQAAIRPTPTRARQIAKMQHPTASIAYVTVRRHLGMPRAGGATYAVHPPKGAKP
jgi:hypothetical protein